MGIMKKFVSPRSKRDRTLPYTYEGWVDILGGQGREPIYDHYFSDTLCGLIEVLDNQDIGPGEVRLFGVFRGEQTPLDTNLLTGDGGRWLMRPELCRMLEAHYEHTHEECYKGHVEKEACAFEDRDRDGSGPNW